MFKKLKFHIELNSYSTKIFMSILILILFVIFIIFYFDKYSFKEIIKLITTPNNQNVVTDLLANTGGGVVFGLLSIVMTVVAIIVELAGNRYTARVSDLFIKDKLNISYLILLSFTSIDLLVVLYLVRPEKIPLLLINLTIALMLLSIITLVPYFIYVFKFLEPHSIISKIEYDVLKSAKSANTMPKNFYSKIDKQQIRLVQGVDQLMDITLNSLDKNDKILATSCIKSLTNFSKNYLDIKNKSQYSDQWFKPSEEVRYNNADFISLTDDSFDLMVNQRAWVEQKIFIKLNAIFQESLNKARDICNFTAQCFYLIGIKALEKNDLNIVNLVIKFFNTLLRASINSNDVRSCFNILNQYRLFGESIIKANKEEIAIEIAKHFNYYGILAYELRKMSFILETTTHDLCYLNKISYLSELDKKQEILSIILNIDRNIKEQEQKWTFRGIRKAQIMLACFYLSHEKFETEEIAIKIFQELTEEIDMDKGYYRIFDIIKELKYVKSDFWEIIDRGMNIDYMPRIQKIQLLKIIDWINIRQIIKYAYYSINNDNENKKKIIKNYSHIIDILPKENLIELKEFEKIFGANNIDNKKNFYDTVLRNADELNINEKILKSTKIINFMPLNTMDKEKVKLLKTGVKKFIKDFKQNISKFF